jgi:RNA polymerase sigma-70 factor, ECF subfamily
MSCALFERNGYYRRPALVPRSQPDLRAIVTTTARDISDYLARIARGDRAAFDKLYGATSAKLFGIILRILNRRDLAEEVLQEVYVKIWQKAGDFEPAKASPISWMAAIARNRALDEVRRVKPVSIEDTPEAMDIPDPGELAITGIERNEVLQKLLKCMEGLEPAKREMVLMAYYRGESREALSQRFGSPVATIKTWLHRSLAQLKACLGQ